MHRVLLLNASRFAANSTYLAVIWPPFCIITHLYTANTFAKLYKRRSLFTPSKPSRELNICNRLGNWWTEKALFVLKPEPFFLHFQKQREMFYL